MLRFNRWRYLFGFLISIYTLIFVWQFFLDYNNPLNYFNKKWEFNYKINYRNETLYIKRLLTDFNAYSLQDRITIENPRQENGLILIWDNFFFDQKNLRGCPDWNCSVVTDRKLAGKADAIIFQLPHFKRKQKPGQYFIFYSQESPVNTPSMTDSPLGFFNFTFGYRQDSPGASPYGFTVEMALKSQRNQQYLKEIREKISSKSKSIAWFVSHCITESLREKIASELQKHIPVDIYGSCGPFTCLKSDPCEHKLNTEYHFYFAAENSICKDYITEKLFHQGFGYLIVPIVLKRELVDKYLPPKSFIAVDDFRNVKDLAEYLRKFFEWKLKYEVIILDGTSSPSSERLWGFCQVCRLVRESHRPKFVISELESFWDKSCEKAGNFTNNFLNLTFDKNSETLEVNSYCFQIFLGLGFTKSCKILMDKCTKLI